MTTQTRVEWKNPISARSFEVWITVGAVLSISFAVMANSPDPEGSGGGVVPLDESTTVSQMEIDAANGILFSPPPSTRDQGASDYSTSVSQMGIDAANGILFSPPSTSIDQGASDYSADVGQMNLDSATGELLGPPAGSRDQGASDYSSDVATMNLDTSAGTLIDPPANSRFQGSTDYLTYVSLFTFNADDGILEGVPPRFPVPGVGAPALTAWGIALLVLIVSSLAVVHFRRRVADRLS
jgi:hypothetical protein